MLCLNRPNIFYKPVRVQVAYYTRSTCIFLFPFVIFFFEAPLLLPIQHSFVCKHARDSCGLDHAGKSQEKKAASKLIIQSVSSFSLSRGPFVVGADMVT